MKLSAKIYSAFTLNRRTLPFWILLLPALVLTEAKAITCGFTETFTDNMSIPVIGLGISTAGEDAPIGKVLYRSSHLMRRVTSYYCTMTIEDLENGNRDSIMNTYSKIEVVSTPSGSPIRSGDKDIFPTNVPGIGVIFTLNGSAPFASTFPAIWERDTGIGYGTVTQGLGQISLIEIEIVKTGAIPPGSQQVLGSSFPSFRVVSGSKYPMPEENVFVNLNFTGTTMVHAKTCQLATSNIDVNLGEHEVNKFTNPGTTTDWKNFDIVLKDCPPFFGYGNYSFIEATGVTSGSNSDNVVNIGFRSANGVVEGNPTLAKLENGPNSATGVGIELSQQSISESILLDGSGGFNLLNLPKEDNATLTIPLKARYVQTESTVKPGMAKGAVVFTITYQ